MKKNILEYIKVASFVIMAVSLSIIAWSFSDGVGYLQEIVERLHSINISLQNLQ